MKVKVFRFRFSGGDMNAGYIGRNLPGERISQVIEKQINDWLAENPTIELQRFEQPVATFDGDCLMQIYIFYAEDLPQAAKQQPSNGILAATVETS